MSKTYIIFCQKPTKKIDIYNYVLNNKIKEYKIAGKSKTPYDQIRLIPSLSKEYQFLKEVDSCALRTSIFNLEDA